MSELKTPASKPFIFIYSKFLYIGSNEYKADFTAIQNVGAKSIFLACHFVPVILLYILWWLALLFCFDYCLLFQSPSKPTTLRFQSHWLPGDFSKCICTFFNQGLNVCHLSHFAQMDQRYPSAPNLFHTCFHQWNHWLWPPSALWQVSKMRIRSPWKIMNQWVYLLGHIFLILGEILEGFS